MRARDATGKGNERVTVADVNIQRQELATPELIGSTLAEFVAQEVKGPRGRVSGEQERFMEFVTQRGGLAVLARSVEDIEGLPTRL